MKAIEDIKAFLVDKVLLTESDVLPADTENILKKIRRERNDNPVIYISSGTSSIISGAEKTFAAAELYVKDVNPGIELVKVGCTGPSNYEPFVCIQLPGKNKLFFRNITEDKLESLVNGVFHNDINEEDLVGQTGSHDFGMWTGIGYMDEMPFFAGQKRIILNNCGCYDPEAISEYIARGGYRTFIKTIRNYTFEEVCSIIEKSGLRGRSGGGYLTGLKWKSALNTPAGSRYLICNARESDPGCIH